MPSPSLSPAFSICLTQSIHRLAQSRGRWRKRVFAGFGLCMRKHFLIEVNYVCVFMCVCVRVCAPGVVYVLVYICMHGIVWWLWLCECVFVEETASEPEGRLWFSWHLYDPGVTGPSLHQTPTTNTQTPTPAVPSTSPLIPPSLCHSFAKGHIQLHCLPSFHLLFLTSIYPLSPDFWSCFNIPFSSF